jgi:hypothetical protein
MPASRPVAVWCKDAYSSDLAHLLGKSQQAGREDTIIIGDKNMLGHSYFLLFKKLRRFWAVSTAKTTIRSMITQLRNIIFINPFISLPLPPWLVC